MPNQRQSVSGYKTGFDHVKVNQMSELEPKTLFFIKSPGSNISAIELYLKKRGFQVFSESDLKTALIAAMKISPDYIFLAWDHTNERIHHLPKIILQSIDACRLLSLKPFPFTEPFNATAPILGSPIKSPNLK